MPSSVAQPTTAHRTGPTSALVNQWWDQELKARERLVVVFVVTCVVLGVVVAVVVVVGVAMVAEVAEETR
jgi:hypothetical protein